MIKVKFDNITTLNDSFISEKNNFNNSTYSSFSNGYISSCQDPEIKRMRDQLDGLYKKINSGYTNIENYWIGYINDTKSLENSLKDFSSKCTNPSVNSYISSYVSDIPTVTKVDNVFNNQEVTISDSITDGGLNFTDVSLSLSDEEMYDTVLGELEATKNELSVELDDLYNEQSSLDLSYDPNDKNYERLQEINEQIEKDKNSIFELEYIINYLQTQKDLMPYNELVNNDDFKDVLSSININDISKYSIEELQNNYTGDNSMIDPLLVAEAAKNMYPNKSDYDLTYDFTILITNIEGADGITYLDVEKYASADQKNLYHYIFKTQGKDAATKYLSLIIDDINKAKGTYEAEQILKTIELDENGRIKDNVINKIYISGVGLDDGLKTFASGLEEAFRNNAKFTAEDYRKMVILQFLNEKSAYYDDLYKFNTALGNMLPVVVTSVISTYAASAYVAGGGSLIGGMSATTFGETSASLLMGLSCYGNSKHSALVNGSSTAKANIYGALSALSEVTLERLLGNIPGVSKTAKFTAAGFIKEGTEEYLQEWIDAGLRSGLLGQPVDWSEVPADAGESFLMGAAMSATFTGVDVIIKYDGQSYNVSKEKILEIYEYVKAHDNNKGCIDLSIFFGKGKNVKTESISDYYSKLPKGRQGAQQNIFWMAVDRNVTSALDEYVSVVQKYHPELSREEAIKYISSIGEDGGICDYAAYTNSITEKYFKEHPEKFKEIYGTDYYSTTQSGKQIARDDLIMLDLYCYLNENKIQNNKYVSSYKTQIKEIGKTNQPRLSDYLKEKGINCTIEEEKIFNNYGVIPWQYNNDLSGDKLNNYIKTSVTQAIENGESVNISVNAKNTAGTLTIKNMDGTVQSVFDDKTTGHVMSVVGIKGDSLIVLNQGILCTIEISEIENINTDIRIVKITDNIDNSPKYNQGISKNTKTLSDADITKNVINTAIKDGGEFIGAGSGNDAYKVTTKDGKEYVVLKHTRDSTNVSVDNFYKQKQIIDNLVDKGVNTPRLIGIEKIDGTYYEVQECASGDVLASRGIKKDVSEYKLYNDNLKNAKQFLEAPTSTYEKLMKDLKTLNENGVGVDEHSDNFMYDPSTKQINIIDIGSSNKYDAVTQEILMISFLTNSVQKSYNNLNELGINNIPQLDENLIQESKNKILSAYENILDENGTDANTKKRLLNEASKKFDSMKNEEKLNIDNMTLEESIRKNSDKKINFIENNIDFLLIDCNENFDLGESKEEIYEDIINSSVVEEIGIENLDIKISDSDGVSIKLKDEYKNKIIEQTKLELEEKRNEVLKEIENDSSSK